MIYQHENVIYIFNLLRSRPLSVNPLKEVSNFRGILPPIFPNDRRGEKGKRETRFRGG